MINQNNSLQRDQMQMASRAARPDCSLNKGMTFLFFFFFCLFAFSRAAPAAYEGSQARGSVGAIATGQRQSHSSADPSHICNLHHSSRQRRILNPLSKGRIEPATSWFLVGFVYRCTTTGTPGPSFLISKYIWNPTSS